MPTPPPTAATPHEVIHNWMPFEVFFKADAPKGKQKRIKGIISTEHRDLQGERVIQDGMDTSPIANGRGWFNDNHDRRTGHELGIPERTYPVEVYDPKLKRKVKATAVEGYLLDTPEAQRVFDVALALQGTNRSLGFSVEGGVIERDPLDEKTITRSVVRQIAITRCPVNPYTRLELVKAFQLTEIMRKAVTVGAQMPGVAGPTVAGDMAPLVPQDLAGARRRRPVNPDAVQMFGDVGFDWDAFNDSWNAKKAIIPARRPTLTKAEAAAYIRLRRPQASDDEIRRILAAVTERGST